MVKFYHNYLFHTLSQIYWSLLTS